MCCKVGRRPNKDVASSIADMRAPPHCLAMDPGYPHWGEGVVSSCMQ